MPDHTLTEREAEMQTRVENWGLAHRGGLPGSPTPDEEAKDPNLLDAEVIEAAMCALRKARYMQYDVMKYLYVRGRSDIEAANYFKRPEAWVQDRNREGLRWLINHFRQERDKVA